MTVKRIFTVILAALILCVPAFADGEVEYDFIELDASVDYGENASIVQRDGAAALTFTDVTFDLTGKKLTGDIYFDFEDSKDATVVMTFSGADEAKVTFEKQTDPGFILCVEKDKLIEKTGDSPTGLRITADRKVTLIGVKSSRVKPSAALPLIIAGAFLAVAVIIPVIYYVAKSRTAHRKRFI